MAEQLMSSGDAYAFDLLNKWKEIGELSEKVRESRILRSSLKRRYTHEEMQVKAQYVAKLSRIWIELYPIVEDRTEFKEISKDFMEFEQYYKNPVLLNEKGTMEEIFEMEKIVRQVIEKLKITKFERSE